MHINHVTKTLGRRAGRRIPGGLRSGAAPSMGCGCDVVSGKAQPRRGGWSPDGVEWRVEGVTGGFRRVILREGWRD